MRSAGILPATKCKSATHLLHAIYLLFVLFADTHTCREAVGKRITPREEVREVPGNHHYCFVDLASAEDAQRAIKELDGTPIPAGTLKVSQAKPPRPRQSDGTGYENRYSSPRRNGALAENGDRPPRSKMESPQPQRSLMSNNWRAKAA